jgi:acetylornithine deacetylase/succinyl-diaminopimelate desuccinylase-like protein
VTVFADTRLERALKYFIENESRIEADQVRITMVPAPPFREDERARVFADDLRSIGLKPISDSIGNVIAAYDGYGRNPVVVGAHLDTIFPAGVPLQLRRNGRVLFLPGIADNGSGIVALLWVMRAAKEIGLRFRRPVIAVGSVGEEGEGNLRGVRHLFSAPPWEGRICDFIAIDVGGVQRVTHRALGSRRFRIRMTGPGGHSWADFGRPNPVHAIATAVHTFVAGAGRRPGVSYNVGVIKGGIAVNAIPSEAMVEVDLRSTTREHLDRLQEHLKRCAAGGASASGVECKIDLIGERPSGQTSVQSGLVQAALEATRRFGLEAQLDVGSTDANIPMSIGIPAIAIGAGGSCGNVHTPGEWFDPLHREIGLQRLLVLVAALAGIE